MNEPASDEAMEDLAARTIRPSRRLSFEDLLASELAAAALSEPLEKIRHVCEALWLLGKDEAESVGITGKDIKEASRLYVLAMALKFTFVSTLVDARGKSSEIYAVIAWPFPRSEAKDWLGWTKGLRVRYWTSGAQSSSWREMLAKLKWPEDVYEMTCNQATVATYRILLSGFARYAMPTVIRLMRKTVGLVSADTYLQTLRILRGKRGKQGG